MSTGQTPQDDYGKPVLALWDDAAQKAIPVHIGAQVTGADGKKYALLDVNATVSPAANQRVNAQSGDFVDGAITTLGAEADAASTDSTQTNKTAMSYIKGWIKMLADVWDGTNHWLQVKVMNGNANGQTTMANSAPVVVASDQSAVKIKADFSEQASLSAGSLNADLVPSTDVSVYKAFSLHITGTWVGTLTLQCSNDNTNWETFFAPVTRTNSSLAGTISSNRLIYGYVTTRYIRVRMTSYTSGSATGTLELYTAAVALSVINTLSILQDANGNAATISNGALNVSNAGLDVTAFASAAQTATQTQADQTNTNARGIKVVLDMTVATASPSVTLEIDGKDIASGKYYAILTGAAVTTVSTNVYTVYPGMTAAANVAANDVLPHTWRVKATANNANSGTYSVGVSLLP